MTPEILKLITIFKAQDAVDRASAYTEWMISNKTIFPGGGDFGAIESGLLGIAKMGAERIGNDMELSKEMMAFYEKRLNGRVSKEEQQRRMETAMRACVLFAATQDRVKREQSRDENHCYRLMRALAAALSVVIGAAETMACHEELIKMVMAMLDGICPELETI